MKVLRGVFYLRLRAYLGLLVVLVFMGGCLHGVDAASSFERDLTLTHSQKVALDGFRKKVVGRVPHKYMKEDIYLVRWLRARNFNIEQAEKMLSENLKWRKENNIDTILEEDWTEFREKFPYFLDTVSKEGQPIFSANFGEWDLREAAFSGKMPKLARYIASFFENSTVSARRELENGKNVTQFDFLVNMDNYNIVQHGCVQCMPYYLNLVNIYENYYPGFVDNIFVFKTPAVFELVLNVIRPLMSPITRNALRVVGHDKEQWTKALLEIVDKSQLTPEYGGTYIRKTN